MHLGVTIEFELLEEFDSLRGRMKRSTFIEHILGLGLKEYRRSKSRRAETTSPTDSFGFNLLLPVVSTS